MSRPPLHECPVSTGRPYQAAPRGRVPHLQASVQVGPRRHLHAEPQLQALPQAQDIPFLLVATLAAVEIEPRLLDVEFICCSVVWLSVEKHSIHPRQSTIERNGYSGRTLTGASPNILLNVREKCAESANPPAWAASVRVSPATYAGHDTY